MNQHTCFATAGTCCRSYITRRILVGNHIASGVSCINADGDYFRQGFSLYCCRSRSRQWKNTCVGSQTRILLLLEDVKHEQLLMLTFSRAAATEFKQRLMELIGNAAHFVEIKTFHSYCFDLMGRIGNLEAVRDVVAKAAGMINQGRWNPTKSVKQCWS